MEKRTLDEPAADADEDRRLLSAMADGEADGAEFSRGLGAWSGADPRLRQCWHAYHLIGDVLRSEDLASAPDHDQRFLQRLRVRLDELPAVLAPQPLPQTSASRRRRPWLVPAVIAAGVMGLATVLVSSLVPSAGGASSPRLAAAPAPAAPDNPAAGAPPATVAAAAAPSAVAEAVPPGGAVVRNAQLDRYLRAHRDYAAALPGSLPGGSGRSIATVSLER
ncbi:MAG TPA: sigma-E factor negative regulatory protein [Rubrivivax sp.]|nr:sigma-E factor negative regulatory protein [Rubrivivax sp.]